MIKTEHFTTFLPFFVAKIYQVMLYYAKMGTLGKSMINTDKTKIYGGIPSYAR